MTTPPEQPNPDGDQPAVEPVDPNAPTPTPPLAIEPETPLRLEETDAGSTHIVDDQDGADSGPVAVPASGSGSGSGTASGSSGGSSVNDGFDTSIGSLVINAGLMTDEEVELCNSLRGESSSIGDAERTLSDVMLENQFVTRRQLERLKREFDTKHSSQSIPGYKIKEKLGAGAMATVFLARQKSLDRLVAIKVLPKKYSDNAKFIDRFYKEGRAAAKLNHPNIVAAYDVGRTGEHHYFVMEFVDGETVYDRIVKQKRFGEKDAIDVVKQVARALQHAHDREFVHRDIKPKNIIIAKDGTVKLADLGLARALTDKKAAEDEAGRAYGTPYYISPEQIRGEVKIGPGADIYGLGATFYHMVTGKVPFEAKNPSSVMHKHLKEELVPPDQVNDKLSASCAQVIEMMMAKSPVDRYHNAADLLEDLDLVEQGDAPHFAHQSLDLSTISPALTGPATEPTVIHRPKRDHNPPSGPLFTMLLILLAASFLGNLLLLAIMANSS